MPTKSRIIGTVKMKMEDGTFVDLPDPISLEELTTFAEQYEFVKVVRCKDCTWFDSPRVCLRHGRFVENSNWFCADGETNDR